MKRTPKLGETLYLLPVGNKARYEIKVKLKEFKVTKVGRKYFELNRLGDPNHCAITFRISDWKQKTEYSADYEVFESELEYARHKEQKAIYKQVRELFSSNMAVPLEALRDIKITLIKAGVRL